MSASRSSPPCPQESRPIDGDDAKTTERPCCSDRTNGRGTNGKAKANANGVVCLPGKIVKRKPGRPIKSISWSDKATLYKFHGATEQDVSNSWYHRNDYTSFRVDCARDCKYYRQQRQDNGVDHRNGRRGGYTLFGLSAPQQQKWEAERCSRGLEYKIDHGRGQIRSERRDNSIRCVLQKQQQSKHETDHSASSNRYRAEEYIAGLYQQYSLVARNEAYILGLQDEQLAMNLHRQQRTEEQQHRQPRSNQQQSKSDGTTELEQPQKGQDNTFPPHKLAVSSSRTFDLGKVYANMINAAFRHTNALRSTTAPIA